MKTCTRCEQLLDESAFFKTRRSKDGYQPACKTCMNVSYASSRSKKQTHYNQVANQRRMLLTERIRQWKEEKGCALCSETFGPCLQLHHLDPTKKEMDPSTAAQYSWDTFLKEASKCVVVCGNCHVKIHHMKIHHGKVALMTPVDETN